MRKNKNNNKFKRIFGKSFYIYFHINNITIHTALPFIIFILFVIIYEIILLNKFISLRLGSKNNFEYINIKSDTQIHKTLKEKRENFIHKIFGIRNSLFLNLISHYVWINGLDTLFTENTHTC